MTRFFQGALEVLKPQIARRHFVTRLDRCERLWKALVSPKCVSDLWEFRLCFHKNFHNKPCFLIIEDHPGLGAMIPLSFADDLEMYFLFPGEVWENKTWLERTPFYCRDDQFLDDLLKTCPENSYLRYLELPEQLDITGLSPDETGYVIYPGNLDYDLSQYYRRFSGKKLKAIRKAIQSFHCSGCRIHYNRLQDFDHLVEMSLLQFGRKSFMYDRRFRESFRQVMHFLNENNMLRMISCEIGGRLAAVDLGAVFKGVYTVFLGGTNPEFQGIAKLMNMNHIEYAFANRLYKIDFLCGDFHWKKLWHLDCETLFKVAPFPSIVELSSTDQHLSDTIGSLNY